MLRARACSLVIAAVLVSLCAPPCAPLAAQSTAPSVTSSTARAAVALRVSDDLRIEQSCHLRMPKTPIADVAGDGVLQIVADGVTVELDGWLVGVETDELDALSGCAIRVLAKNVTLRAPRIRGFKVGIWASGADGLVVEDGEFERNYAQRLRSTSAAEDASDWLFPHDNDANQWLVQHGAAIYVEDSRDVELARNRVRRAQNGLVLDRVEGARVYDNDASFLSGWGLALWRTSHAVASRNAFDFCVRGYSHGVYNRGQDSAGMLVFEQCSDNVFIENSATHGGDGFFGFGGKEALGEKPAASADFDATRKGCNDNVFVGNDFSYAAAHGLELTFSFGNVVRDNRFVENGICGIWGGYSQGFHIAHNEFARNGGAGYGDERGAINIEHAQHERIEDNRFDGDACGVRMWWDADEGLAKLPWARANGTRCAGNQVLANSFRGMPVGLHVRGCSGVLALGNRFEEVAVEIDAEDGLELTTEDPPPAGPSELDVLGRRHPVGARKSLAGREHIVITEWGPYDWKAPLLQRMADRDGAHVWRFLGAQPLRDVETVGAIAVEYAREAAPPVELVVRARDEHAALVEYTLIARTSADEPRAAAGAESAASAPAVAARITSSDTRAVASAAFENVVWSVRAFAWTRDPRTDEAGWRREAAKAAVESVRGLRLEYGQAGPSELADGPQGWRAAKLPRDRFGTLASASPRLAAGRYALKVTSDDGVRVRVDGKVVLEDWTWHAPKSARVELSVEREREVKLEVEHFELDGFAVLEVGLRRVGAR